MEFATGNGADTNTSNSGWWAVESALSPSPIFSKDSDILSAGLIQEYSVLAGVAANMSSGFLLLNARERVTYFNASAVRLLGINSHDLIEQPIFDVRKQLLALAAEPERVQDELDRAWFSPEQESSTDMALADAAVRWLRVRCFPMWDVQGHLLGRGVLLDDITLERSSFESRGETLALAAHELKTPLAVIKGCATTLLGNSTRWDPVMQREMLQMIDTHADRLYDVLNTLLDVWRLDSGAQTLQLAQVQISELLRQVVERWQKAAPRHAFELTIPPDVPLLVVCDAVRLAQAQHSLLSNAVTYSPNGGTITIRLESNDVEIRLSIADEGVGIAAEHLDRIFERFYRVQPREGISANGSGLGLAVARATFEAHGGRIWADSPGLGQGATIYCTLPFAPRLSAQFKQQTQPLSASPSGPLGLPAPRSSGLLKQSQRAYVLVAEGDARMTRYLRANLEEHAYRVQTVNHGVQFLRQLDLEEPDLILLSTRLADISGLELLQRLREFAQIPVVMLCDECDEDERVRLFDLGADDLVVKPFGMKELLARLRALLRRQSAPGEQLATQAIFTTGELTIDYAQHQVFLQGRPVQLSRTEYKLLSTLAHNVGIVLTHEVLLERVWGPEYNREVDFIWVYISRLRRKIEADPRHPTYILTVPDVGYKLAKL
jgi:DNA-binding response OmpR family regulator/signal transduction histidine kinase